MKKVRVKIILPIILLILSCFSLYGCSDKYQTVIKEQDSIHITVTPSGIPDNVNNADPVIRGNDSTVNDASSEENNNTSDENNENQDNPTVTSKPGISENSTMPVFRETSETVYAAVNVNVRTSCKTSEDNIIYVLPKGSPIKRIGISEGWSKVLFRNEECYIKNEYLSLEKPSPTPAPVVTKAPAATPVPSDTGNNSSDTSSSEKKDFVTELKIASKLNKLIIVIGNGGADCIVSFHTKDKVGTWTQQFETDGDCGYKGITYNKKEGDGKTPAGLYSFTMAFGIKKDPGAKLTYRQVTEYDYWVDDVKSPYYDTWVNSLETPGDYSSEHLIDHAPQYNYALNINYNSSNTPGLGSAIFLHGYNGKGQTTGCIAISEKYVKTLVQEADSSTMILIVPEKEDLENY